MPSKTCSTSWYPDRADIQQDSSTDDDPQEDFSGDSFKSGIPGRVIDTGGDETFRGRQIEPHISHVFECRYFAGILPTMRLKLTAGIYKDRLLNIEYVKIVRDKGKIPKQMLYCKELADV